MNKTIIEPEKTERLRQLADAVANGNSRAASHYSARGLGGAAR